MAHPVASRCPVACGTPGERRPASMKFGGRGFKGRIGKSNALSLLPLPSGDGTDNEQRFPSLHHRFGQGRVRRLVREVFFAREKAQKWTPFERVVIADGADEHGIARLDRIKDGTNGNGRCNLERNLGADLGEIAQVVGKLNADWRCGHGEILQ